MYMKTKMSNLWKQLLVISTVVLTHGAFAQAPQKMSYQAVIRDNANQLIANTAIGMQVSILEGSSSGTPVYVETHNPSTNQNGLVSVELGSGTQVSGDFTTIDWSLGDYFVKIETDPAGGNTYSITGTSQLLSVPYALYAESTNETDPEVASVTTNRIPKWNGTALADGSVTDNGTNVGVGTSAPADKLHVVGNTRVDGGRIDFRNTGNSIRIGENAGLNDNLNDNSNVFIGTDAGQATISGSGNIGIGQGSLESTLSSGNVAIGYGAFNNNINGFNNVGLGTEAGYLNNSDNNTFLGSHAGYNNVGTANIFIGAYAGYYETASDKLYIHNSDVTDPLIYGDFVTRDLTFNGSVGIDAAPDAANKLTVNGNTATTNFQMTAGATENYILQSDASGNGTWVDPASLAVTETDPKVMTTATNQIPKWNGTALSDGQITDNGTNIGIGTASPTDKLHIAGSAKIDNGRLTFANTGNSVFIGENSGQNDDHTNNNNVYIGYQTGQTGVVANNNIGVGYQALKSTLADNNVAIGSNSLKSATTAYQNAAFGSSTLTDNLTGNYNVALGNEALKSNSSGSSNVAVGVAALFYNTTGSGNIAIGREAGMNETGSNKLYIDNSNTATPLIWGDFGANILTVNGSMGIGTTTPTQAKLVVNGSASNNIASFGYLSSTGVTGTNGGTNTYSIYASARIAATEFNAFSDARIKKVKGVSDSKADLAILSTIKITDYQLIDSIAKGNRMIKKVIAQELEQVYPQAVSTHTDVVPDIYTRAEITNGYIALKNNLKAGEKVRLILPTGEELLEVASATENGFTVASNQTGPVFVYGREVSDFHTVDYEALTTLTISATQELLMQIEALQNKVAGLEQENNNLKAEVQSIEAVKRDLEELKRLIYNAPANTASTTVEVTK
jgi:Chaperone of endosialidase